MDARAKTVREILYSGNQYLIPFFQRFYSWKPQQWERLRNDLWALIESDDESQHFMGPLVCTPTKIVPTEVPAFELIDGQQRLTTLIVALAALRDVAKERQDSDLAIKIARYFLLNEDEEGLQRYKVLPRLGDREALIAIIEGKWQKDFPDTRIDEAWQYFRGVFSRWTLSDPKMMLHRVFKALTTRLSLVVITIDGENPYEIFESLNSTGLPLEESDLIRNFLFMQVPLTSQDKFFRNHWKAFEALFEAKEKYPAVSATAFYRNYLMRKGTYSKAGSTFVDFKEQNKQSGMQPEEQVAELATYARFELMLHRPRTCKSAALGAVLANIQSLEITTAHSLIMHLLDLGERGVIEEAMLVGCLEDLASFAMRRSICGETTRGYSRWFPEAIRAIKDNPREDLQQYWLRRGWPDDETFQKSLVDFAIYRREPRKGRLLLETLERLFKHKEPVDLATLTVEHVMPQGIADDKWGKTWQAMLGDDWQKTHERWLHTLGNLTLSGYNSDMSNRPYADKKKELANSHLQLNKHFAEVEHWNEAAIQQRGSYLAGQVVKLWARPPGKYVPGTDGDQKAPPGRERRQAFWIGLAAILKSKNVGIQPIELTSSSTISFPSPIDGVEFWAFFFRRHREMQVGLTFRRKRGRVFFDHLRDESAMMGEVGEVLRWVPGTTPTLCAVMPEASLKNAQEWHAQQEWLAAKVEAILKFVFPRLKQIDVQLPIDAGKATDTKEKQVAFWSAFRDFMAAEGSQLKPTKPLPQHWNNIHIGLGTTKLCAIASTWDSEAKTYESNEIRAELIFEGKHAKDRFRKLIESRESIEAELGERPFWHDPENAVSCKIYVRRPVKLNDLAEWPVYFGWLKAKLEPLFQSVLAPRIKTLGHVGATEETDAV